MRQRLFGFGLLCLLWLCLSSSVPPGWADSSFPKHLTAVLTQAEEVPPTGSLTTGTVDVQVQYSRGGIATALAFRATIREGVQLRQLHFHCAPRGVNGPVIAFMAGRHDGGVNVDKGLWVRGTLTDQAITSTGTGITTPITCATATGPGTGAVIATIDDLVQQVLAGNIYICAHDAAFPGGATRGQVVVQGSRHGD